MGTSMGLCGAPPTIWGAHPGANREAVFLLTGKQASCVWPDRRGLRRGAWSQLTAANRQPLCLGSPSWGAVLGAAPMGGSSREPEKTRCLDSTRPAQNRRRPSCQEPWCVLAPPRSPSHPPLGSLPPGAQRP